MTVTVCAICLEPLTTSAVTPVHAACLGVDADLLDLARAAVAYNAAIQRHAATGKPWSLFNHDELYYGWLTKARAIIERAERTTITDEPNGTDAPTQGDDHAE